MAIINVTQKNFTKVIAEKLDNMGGMGLLAASLMGGKDEMKKAMIAMVKEGDSDMQFLCRLLAETNRGMDFKYKGNDSGKSLTIHLTKDELKRALGL